MSRNALPRSAVKVEPATRRRRLPKQLDDDVSQFGVFYGTQTGGKVPDDPAVLIGIVRHYLQGNGAFQPDLAQRARSEKTSPLKTTVASATTPVPAAAPVAAVAAG